MLSLFPMGKLTQAFRDRSSNDMDGGPSQKWAFASGDTLDNIAVGLFLLLFFLTGLAYSLVVPPFETPDEIYHYAFARHLAAGNGLPVQATEKTGPWEQEGSQPPLYYSLVALATAGIDQTGLEDFAVRNPRVNMGDPHQPGNKNFMLFSAERAPLQGVNLALHVGRWISLVLGALTVYFTYLLTRYAFPQDRWAPAFWQPGWWRPFPSSPLSAQACRTTTWSLSPAR